MLVIRRVSRVGDSLGITVPRAILRALGWELGDQVLFGVAGGKVTLRKIVDTDVAPAIGPEDQADALEGEP